jgi:hypothetical protein
VFQMFEVFFPIFFLLYFPFSIFFWWFWLPPTISFPLLTVK